MSRITIDIEIPDRLRGTEVEKKLVEKTGRYALEQAVLDLYKEGAISTGTGAELLGMPLYDFIRFLGQHEVTIFNYMAGELEQDVQAAMAAHDAAKKEKEDNQ